MKTSIEVLAERRLSRQDPSSPYFVNEENLEIVPVQGMSKGLKRVDDIYLPTLVKNLSLAKTIQVRNQDTFVIGYPKSG
jgi:hypothetical protein